MSRCFIFDTTCPARHPSSSASNYGFYCAYYELSLKICSSYTMSCDFLLYFLMELFLVYCRLNSSARVRRRSIKNDITMLYYLHTHTYSTLYTLCEVFYTSIVFSLRVELLLLGKISNGVSSILIARVCKCRKGVVTRETAQSLKFHMYVCN